MTHTIKMAEKNGNFVMLLDEAFRSLFSDALEEGKTIKYVKIKQFY